jgi:hypothetical protein
VDHARDGPARRRQRAPEFSGETLHRAALSH